MNALISIIRKRPLATAIGLSAAVHLILFLPNQPAKPEVERVLNAELTLSHLKARPAIPPSSPQKNDIPPADATSTSEKATAKHSVPQPHHRPETRGQSTREKTESISKVTTEAAPTRQTTNQATNQATTQTGSQTTTNNEQGLPDRFDELSSDPSERSYQQQILAHLRNHLAAPAEYSGSVRLSMTIRYGQIATNIQVLRSSGNPALDDWAVKAAIAANPYPPVPAELSQPFTFRPTLAIGR